jgi:hypothetical protein
MKDEGWTLGDLDGELWARGLTLDDVADLDLSRVTQCSTPEQAAAYLESRAGFLDGR